MKAEALRRLDKERDIHLQAYLNNAVTATVNRGKREVPKYQQFQQFFDYDKYKKEILGTKETKDTKKQKIKQLVLLANRKGG